MNRATIIGRLTRDPELRTLQDNTAVCSVTVAVDRRSKDKVTDFIPVVLWRQQAEFLAAHAAKGTRIAVSGRIQVRQYTDRDGSKRTATEIVAEDVEIVDAWADKAGQQDNRTAAQKPAGTPDESISLPFDLDLDP